MPTLTVEAPDLGELVSSMKDMGIDIEYQTQRNVATAAVNIEGGAKNRAPVRKKPVKIKGAWYKGGNLRKKIRKKLNTNGPLEATVVAGAPYSEPVEKGHRTRSGSKVPAQPFLVPAADEELPKFIAREEDVIREATEWRS